MRLQFLTVPERLRSALRLNPRHLAALDEGSFRVPDTPAAKDAEARLAELGRSAIVGHSHRTFAFATVLAARDGVRYDEEVVYVAALLHDVGLAPEFRSEERPKPCFTLDSAAAAEQIARSHGWSAARAHTAADAITMHLNTWVSPEVGAEAHLVHAGAYLDAMGARYPSIAPDTLRWILERHPRNGTKRELIERVRDDSAISPGTRAAFYRRWLMLGLFIRTSQFDE